MGSALEAALGGQDGFTTDVMERSRQLVLRYFDAINNQELDALSLLTSEDVLHDLQASDRRVGQQDLMEFFSQAYARCREHVFDIEVMVSVDGHRAAAEFTVLGIPLSGGEHGAAFGTGQTCRLHGGTFFEIRDDRIARISNYGEPSPLASGVSSALPHSV